MTTAIAAAKKYVEQHKQADAPPMFDSPDLAANAAGAIQYGTSEALKSQLLQRLVGLGVGTLGVGAAARGALGLYNMTRRNVGNSNYRRVGPVPVDVPYPVRPKQAEFDWSKFMKGDYARSLAAIPWAAPATLAVGAGGLYGGWKGMDALLDKRRKNDMGQDLEQARGEYDDALMAQFDHPKTAGVKVGLAIDELFDKIQELHAVKKAAVEKQAGDESPLVLPGGTTSGDLKSGAGIATGMYGILAGLGTAGTAALVYDAMKKRQDSSVLEAAQRRRQRRLFERSPTTLFARPVPVPTAQLHQTQKSMDQEIYNGLN